MPAVTGFAAALKEQVRRLLADAGAAVPRVVAFGIDTLYLHWKVPVSSDLAATLRALQSEAADNPISKGGGIPIVELGGFEFEVKAHASKTAPLLLHCENVMDVHINPVPLISNMPTIAIELRSVWLWTRGAHRAVADACDVVDGIIPDATELPAALLVPQVTRVDICADFQWGEVLKDNMLLLYPATLQGGGVNTPGIRTRADNFVSYWKVKKRKCTGATYGDKTSDVSAGIYNKTEEIAKVSLKTWFLDVWRKSPNYVEGDDVWRLEFRLKREGLRRLQCPGVKRPLLTWPELADHLQAVWKYLTGSWLVWRGQRTKETRHTIDERWAPLHNVDVGKDFHNGCPLVISKRIEVIGEMATAQTCGYLAQMKAHVEFRTGREVTLDEAMVIILDAVLEHGEQSGRPLEQRCKERRLKFQTLSSAGAREPQKQPYVPHGWSDALSAAEVLAIERELRRELHGETRKGISSA